MKTIKKRAGLTVCIFILLCIFVSCASRPELKINYSMPSATDELNEEKVYLSFDDARRTKDIIGGGAKKVFRNFSGNISLSIEREHDEAGFKIGLFDLRNVFLESFTRKLEGLGMTVVSNKMESQNELMISVNEFVLDLVDGKWISSIDYEARLILNGELRAKQMITSQAERFKLVGQSQANILMGEIFTDSVNRLDVGKLYKQVKK